MNATKIMLMHRIKDNLSCMLLGKQNKEQYNKWPHSIFSVSPDSYIYEDEFV